MVDYFSSYSQSKRYYKLKVILIILFFFIPLNWSLHIFITIVWIHKIFCYSKAKITSPTQLQPQWNVPVIYVFNKFILLLSCMSVDGLFHFWFTIKWYYKSKVILIIYFIFSVQSLITYFHHNCSNP